MALIRYGPIVDQVAGSIGGTTFTNSAAGNIAITRAQNCNPQTNRQASARLTLATIAKQWQLLTLSQQNAWKAASQARPYANALGHVRTLPGYQFFQKFNVVRLIRGESLITTPPASWAVTDITAPSLTATLTNSLTQALAVAWNSGASSPSDVQIQTTGPMSWGSVPDTHTYVNVATIPAGTTTPVDITTDWITVWGALPDQLPYKIRVRFWPINPTTAVKGCHIDQILAVPNTPSSSPWTVVSDASQLPPPPTITGISPTSGPITGGTDVTITGTGFLRTDVIMFGTLTAPWWRTDSSTQTIARSPALPPGVVHIRIHGRNGCSAATSADEFTALGIAGTITTTATPPTFHGTATIAAIAGTATLHATAPTFTGAGTVAAITGTATLTAAAPTFAGTGTVTSTPTLEYFYTLSEGPSANGTLFPIETGNIFAWLTSATVTVYSIRFYKPTGENLGPHTGNVWNTSTGALLATVLFTAETPTGWQEQLLATPYTVAVGPTEQWSISVNTTQNDYYYGGVPPQNTTRDILTLISGCYNPTPGAFPSNGTGAQEHYTDIGYTH